LSQGDFPFVHPQNNNLNIKHTTVSLKSINSKIDSRCPELFAAVHSVVNIDMSAPQVCDLPGPQDRTFTPLLLLSKYPFHYLAGQKLKAVDDIFFNEGKFWERSWNIWATYDLTGKPWAFVPRDDFMSFMAEISHRFSDVDLKSEDDYKEALALLTIPNLAHCLPRYLGISRSKADFANLMMVEISKIVEKLDHEEPMRVDDFGTCEGFWMDVQLGLAKNYNAEQRAKARANHRVKMLNESIKILHRMQKYLGIKTDHIRGK
jgi:hypothetical protein